MTYLLVMTRHVSVAEAKAQLSALLTAVEQGETVTITRHGKPIAALTAAPVTKKRRGGEFAGNPEWDHFIPSPDLFAPMTDEELRAEGWQ